LFSGDTLFSAGIGRFFEGNEKEMYKNIEKIITLPKETLLFCGHEYLVDNLRFCNSKEPENEKIKVKFMFIK
jgi:hydroxyacylglutathione hydrolase